MWKNIIPFGFASLRCVGATCCGDGERAQTPPKSFEPSGTKGRSIGEIAAIFRFE